MNNVCILYYVCYFMLHLFTNFFVFVLLKYIMLCTIVEFL